MRLITIITVFMFAGLGTMLALVLLVRLHTSFLLTQLPHDDYAGRLKVYSVPLPGGWEIAIAGCLAVIGSYYLYRFIEQAISQ